MGGWASFTPATGFRLHSAKWLRLGTLVRHLKSVARRGGYLTIFDDEVA
jgi:hypothetical protein